MGTWRRRWCVCSGGETSQATSTPWLTAMQVSSSQRASLPSSPAWEQLWGGWRGGGAYPRWTLLCFMQSTTSAPMLNISPRPAERARSLVPDEACVRVTWIMLLLCYTPEFSQVPKWSSSLRVFTQPTSLLNINMVKNEGMKCICSGVGGGCSRLHSLTWMFSSLASALKTVEKPSWERPGGVSQWEPLLHWGAPCVTGEWVETKAVTAAVRPLCRSLINFYWNNGNESCEIIKDFIAFNSI